MPIKPLSSPDPTGETPEAAVALIRVSGLRPEYLLLRRAANPLDPWSGHYALPGGRREAQDGDLLETCIRETREECGLDLNSEAVCGGVRALPHFSAGKIQGRITLVAPFLFELSRRPALTLDPVEIASHHWIEADYLLEPSNHGQAKLSQWRPETSFPCIWFDSGAIWGFTYEVLWGHLSGLELRHDR